MSARDQRFKAVHRGGPLTLDDHRQLANWAADCAEHVLHLFTNENHKDDRPSTAITLARAWTRDGTTVGDARNAAFAAHDAARDANSDAATFAARAAGHAVATAHMADHEINAAAYAIKAVISSVDEKDADANEYDWQRQHLPDQIQELVGSAFRLQYLNLVPVTGSCSDKDAG